jgi:hypothetical protein
MQTKLLLALTLLLPPFTLAASSVGFTSDDHNVYINTPGHSGTVIIDGTVDIKQMQETYARLAAEVDMVNATLIDALAVNRERQVFAVFVCLTCRSSFSFCIIRLRKGP